MKKQFYHITRKFFPRVTKNADGNIKLTDDTVIKKQVESIRSMYKKTSKLEKKDIASLAMGKSEVEYDKTKKDFPLLFSSDDENDFSYAEKNQKDKEKRQHDLDIDKVKLASYETIMDLPEHIERAAKKVFTKYQVPDIREWTKKYLLLYSQNHANEPPLDLTKLKKIPFGNSDELDIKTKYFKAIENDSEVKDKTKETENYDGEYATGTPEYDALVKKYFKNKGTTVNPLLRINYTPPFAVAYLYSRMPYTYVTIKRIVEEVKKRNPSFEPESVLDYGAGLGSGVLACMDVYDQLKKVAAVEPNKYMRKLGKYITEKANVIKDSSFNTEIIWVDSLAMLPGSGGMERGKFDIVILSHVLQEVVTAKNRELIISTLYNRLSSKGIFVVVEPGSPKGFRFIHDIREWVREKIDDQKKKAERMNEALNKEFEGQEAEKYKIEEADLVNIIAPCPHNKPCPFASKTNEWCHFSQISYKYRKSVFPRMKAERNVVNEKYCYLVLKKGKHILNDLETYDVEKKLTVQEESYKWSRIVRPKISKDKHIILDLCTTKGDIERRIISKSMSKEGGYKAAKDLKWGELWSFPHWIPNKFRKEKLRGKRLW